MGAREEGPGEDQKNTKIKSAEDLQIGAKYCSLSPHRRRFVLAVVTIAGFFGPLAGAIYLPALPILEREFHVGTTAINATVAVFMVTFALAVSEIT